MNIFIDIHNEHIHYFCTETVNGLFVLFLNCIVILTFSRPTLRLDVGSVGFLYQLVFLWPIFQLSFSSGATIQLLAAMFQGLQYLLPTIVPSWSHIYLIFCKKKHFFSIITKGSHPKICSHILRKLYQYLSYLFLNDGDATIEL